MTVKFVPDPDCPVCRRGRVPGRPWPCPLHAQVRVPNEAYARGDGECAIQGCPAPLATKRHCERHRRHVNAYRVRRRREGLLRQSDMEWIRARQAAGLCVMCSRPSVSKSHCAKHRDRVNELNRTRRARIRMAKRGPEALVREALELLKVALELLGPDTQDDPQ